MNRVFCILVVLACFAVLSQVAVQAQNPVIGVDDGTNVSILDAVAGVSLYPDAGSAPQITIVAGTGSVKIVGATTTFGAIATIPVVTIDNATGNISGVGTLGVSGATTVGDFTANNAGVAGTHFTVAAGTGNTAVGGTLGVTGAITTTGGFTAVGVAAGTGLLEGIGGLEVTSPNGLQTINVNDSGTFIDGTDDAGNGSMFSSNGTSSVVGAMEFATGNTSIMTVNGLGTNITTTDEVSGDSSSLTVSSTSIDMTGGIDNNFDGITNAGRISGVSDGVGAFDAVNRRQLDGLDSNLSSGIASIAALASIPAPICGKNYSAGLGYGHYNGESAYAVGVKANIPQSNISLAAGVGFSTNSSPAANVGASLSW